MWGRVTLLACVLAAATSQVTEVSRCIYNEGELPIYTVVEGCTTSPCPVPQLQDIVVHMVFVNPYAVTEMTTLATAYMTVIGIPLPIPWPLGENAETCNFLVNADCPVDAGQPVHYTLRMHVEEFMLVGTEIVTEIRVVDTSHVPISCTRVTLRIVPPVSAGVIGPSGAVDNQLAIDP